MRRIILASVAALTLFAPAVSFAVTGQELIPSWRDPSPSQTYLFSDHVVIGGTWQLPPGWVGNIDVYVDATVDPDTGQILTAGTRARDVNTGNMSYSISNVGGAPTISGNFSIDIGQQVDGAHNVYIQFWGGTECAINSALNAQNGTNYQPTCATTADNFAPGITWPSRDYVVGPPPYPRMVVTPSTDPALNFSNIVLGTEQTFSFSITNTGDQTLMGSVSGFTEPFSCIPVCSYSINPDDPPAVISVRFSPTAAPASYSNTLSFTCNGSTLGCEGVPWTTPALATQVRNIIGNSVTNPVPPALSLIPASINYGQVNLGAAIPDRTITVNNTGGGILNGTVTFTSPRFSCVTTCNYSILAGQNATIDIRYVPTAAGTYNERADFTGGGGGSVTLQSEVNDQPILEVIDGDVDFGTTVNVGTCVEREEYIRNTGAGNLSGSITGIAIAPYAPTNAPSGFSCVAGACNYSNLTNAMGWQEVTLRFCPTSNASVNVTAQFTNTTNPSGGDTAFLHGQGNSSPIGVIIGSAPATVAFGNVLVGGTVYQTVSIENVGVGALNGSVGPASDPSYTCLHTDVSPDCSYSIAAGDTVTFTLAFHPTAVRSYDNETMNFPGAGVVVLDGNGVEPSFYVTYDPSVYCPGGATCLPPSPKSHDVGTAIFGGSGSARTVRFALVGWNGGLGASVNYTFPNTTHFFCLGGQNGHACSDSFAPGDGDVMQYEFVPDAVGDFTEPLVITYDYGDSVSRSMTLHLTGHSISAPYLSVSPFRNIPLGEVRVGVPVTATILASNLGVGSLNYTVTNGSEWEWCADENRFCAFSGTKEVHYGALDQYTTRTLTGGTDCSNDIFGDPYRGQLKSCWYTISPAAAEFDCTNNCSGSGLLTDESRAVEFTFTPTVAAKHIFFPIFTSNGGNIGNVSGGSFPSITGAGVLEPIISVTPSNLSFPDTNQGLATRRQITIKNEGLGTLSGNIAQVRAPGLNFYCVLGCSYNLAAGMDAPATIEFGPTTVNPVGSPLSAILLINSNAINGVQNLPVFGNGIFAPIIDVRGSDTNFGRVVTKKFKEQTFIMSNSGSASLGSGTVDVTGPFTCVDPLDPVDGLCHYDLGAGEEMEVTIRFSPLVSGPANGSVSLSGVPVARFFVNGTGVLPSVKFIER